MPQERAEKRIDELVHIGTVSDTAKVPMEDNGEAYYAEIGQLGIPRSADVDDDNGIVSFKDGAGVVLFTVDLAGIGGGGLYFGKLVVSTNTLSIEEEQDATFTVVLQEAPSQDQNVYLAVSDGLKIAVSPSVLTFTPQNWNIPQTVTVTALPDADSDDESETITLTSRKVPSKQISVSVTDITEPPVDLITDGLGLYFNLRNGESGLTDSVNGVVATNNGCTFGENGCVITGSNNLSWKYPITTNIPNGFTIEFVLTSNLTSPKFSIPTFDASGEGFGNGYAYKTEWVGSTALEIGFAYIANGAKVTQTTVPIGGNYANTDFLTEHTFSLVYNADGSAFVSLDGVKQGAGRAAPSGFERYEVSGSPQFKVPYNSASTKQYEIAGIRFYNRGLTETELLNNHRHDVQQQANATFTGGQAE